jgi:peptidyl-tRNA hydrolase
MIKQYCIFPKDIVQQVPVGKLCGQAGHAFVGSLLDTQIRFPLFASQYLETKEQFKIVLVTKNTNSLLKLQEAYKDICGTHLVTDLGFTVFEEPTITCLGLGPLPDNLKAKDLQRLQLM